MEQVIALLFGVLDTCSCQPRLELYDGHRSVATSAESRGRDCDQACGGCARPVPPYTGGQSRGRAMVCRELQHTYPNSSLGSLMSHRSAWSRCAPRAEYCPSAWLALHHLAFPRC
eukprot:7065707-Prymnesium_polylepis.1